MKLSPEEINIINSILFINDELKGYSSFPAVLIYHLPSKDDFVNKPLLEIRNDSEQWMSQNWNHYLFSDILHVINTLEDRGYIYIDKPKGATLEEYIIENPDIIKEIPKLGKRDKMTSAQLLRHKYANIHVYPSLSDFKLNDYKTTEEKQLEEAQKQTKAAQCQTKILVFTLVITLLTPIGESILNYFTQKKEPKVKVEIENFQDIPQKSIIYDSEIDSTQHKYN